MPKDIDGPLAATLNRDEELGEHIFKALSSPAACVGEPYISEDENFRCVTIDGRFDLVVAARLLRETLRADLIKWLDQH